MPVDCIQVADVLAIRGLQRPELEVLAPTNQSYRALVLQPAGPIFADANRIGHRNAEEASLRCSRFLGMATQRGNHLVVVPEYCIPIETLLACARGDAFPAIGALWVLGCESLTPAALEAFKQSTAGYCEVIHEVDQAAPVQGIYYDAVAYCFVSSDADGAPRRVVLFQFKTCPSKDPHFLENENLRIGRVIYQFRNTDEILRLSAIICSDAFTVGDDAALCRKLTDRATLIHIQLNPKPRHTDYRKYRSETFARHATLSDCDIVCLNWAQNIIQYEADAKLPTQWGNIGGSTWYLPKARCSTHDQEVIRNDSKGLYYSLLERRRHVLMFHYDEAAFELTVPKLAIDGPAIIANPLGPQVANRFTWDVGHAEWTVNPEVPDAGFDSLLAADEHVATAFASVKNLENRLNIERAVALSCGPNSIAESWQSVDKIETCQMKADEVVNRTTFCMDPCDEARDARNERVQRVASLSQILTNEPLPKQIHDLMGGGAEISWSEASPNTNVAKKGCRPALVAFLGIQPAPERIKGVADGFITLLRREGAEHHRRAAVCYRKANGAAEFAEMPALTRIDDDGGSLANIAKALE